LPAIADSEFIPVFPDIVKYILYNLFSHLPLMYNALGISAQARIEPVKKVFKGLNISFAYLSELLVIFQNLRVFEENAASMYLVQGR
jgi:hypothetical protein